ncbi:hypothetical protein B005_1855 [Nocardiopsis alba ATCC BAA-2165]|uniref:Uncharacterized protein n=1 Tax=Nocardiopsis alba (strain ATCC BAA-2165 / BE74) TaxID=1205910 RepID=J7LEF4_NOCAA|nr:hypothetical protein B005_1855 [Nocardiopsis alba ATCC BAA-2165]
MADSLKQCPLTHPIRLSDRERDKAVRSAPDVAFHAITPDSTHEPCPLIIFTRLSPNRSGAVRPTHVVLLVGAGGRSAMSGPVRVMPGETGGGAPGFCRFDGPNLVFQRRRCGDTARVAYPVRRYEAAVSPSTQPEHTDHL